MLLPVSLLNYSFSAALRFLPMGADRIRELENEVQQLKKLLERHTSGVEESSRGEEVGRAGKARRETHKFRQFPVSENEKKSGDQGRKDRLYHLD